MSWMRLCLIMAVYWWGSSIVVTAEKTLEQEILEFLIRERKNELDRQQQQREGDNQPGETEADRNLRKYLEKQAPDYVASKVLTGGGFLPVKESGGEGLPGNELNQRLKLAGHLILTGKLFKEYDYNRAPLGSIKVLGDKVSITCEYKEESLDEYPILVLYKNRDSRSVPYELWRGYMVYWRDLGDPEGESEDFLPPGARRFHGCYRPECNIVENLGAGYVKFRWTMRESDHAHFVCLQGMMQDEVFYAKHILYSQDFTLHSSHRWKIGQEKIGSHARYALQCRDINHVLADDVESLYVAVRIENLGGTGNPHTFIWLSTDSKAALADTEHKWNNVTALGTNRVEEDWNAGHWRYYFLKVRQPSLLNATRVGFRLVFLALTGKPEEVECFKNLPYNVPESWTNPTYGGAGLLLENSTRNEPVIYFSMSPGIKFNISYQLPEPKRAVFHERQDGQFGEVEIKCKMNERMTHQYPVMTLYHANNLASSSQAWYSQGVLRAEDMQQNRTYIIFYKAVSNRSNHYDEYFPLGSPPGLACRSNCSRVVRGNIGNTEYVFSWQTQPLDEGEFMCLQGRFTSGEDFEVLEVVQRTSVHLFVKNKFQYNERLESAGGMRQTRPLPCGGYDRPVMLSNNAISLSRTASNILNTLPLSVWYRARDIDGRPTPESMWIEIQAMDQGLKSRMVYDQNNGTFVERMTLDLMYPFLRHNKGFRNTILADFAHGNIDCIFYKN